METVLDRTIESPLGPIRLLASGGALVGVRLPRHHSGKVAATGDGGGAEGGAGNGKGLTDRNVLDRAAAELEAYFSGSLRRFSTPVAFSGTPFQERVWRALLTIPFGESRSYGWLANAIGRPTAARAVGAANGRNPLGIIVPCHRVIGADGSLTGYGGGLEAKQWLLQHEMRAGAD